MRRGTFAATALVVAFFGCVGDSNNGSDAGPDVATDAADAATDVPVIPTGAKLTLGISSIWVAQNGQAQVPFTIARNGVPGALTVHAASLPSGVTAADATVADGQSNGTLTLAAGSSVKLGDTATASVQLLDQTQTEDTQSLVVRVSGTPGTLDTTWGQGGVFSLALTYRTIGYAIDVYPPTAGANAGKIIVAGVENNSLTDVRLIIARLLPSGALDTTFGDLVADGGTTRSGYVSYNPGASDDTKITTYPPAVRIDSKGRVVMINNHWIANVAPFCDVDLTRFTADGDLDSTFTVFTGGINGVYCGGADDLRILPNDDVAVLAHWNVYEGAESVIQLFSGKDGSRQGSGYHIRLDNSGTNTNQQTTYIYRFVLDKNGGYVLAGEKCDGGWNNSPTTTCTPAIARLTSAGVLDSTFGATSGYTGFTFGSGTSQTFFGAAIDPKTNDIIAVGRTGDAKLATMARVSSTGLLTTFGSGGSLTRDLLGGSSGEYLTTPLVDSASRIVAAGNASTSQTFVANTRAASNGTADLTYGTNGVNATTPGALEEAALGNDDRLYVAGYSGTRLVVWRFWP